MDAAGRLTVFIRECREGKRTIRETVKSTALVASAAERTRTLALIRRTLPEPVAEDVVRRIISLGVLQVVGLDAVK